MITQESNCLISGYTNAADAINDLPLIVFGDYSCSFKYVDFEFVRGADGTQLLKTDENEIITKFLYEYLLTVKIDNSDRYERHYKYLKDIQVPVPSLEVQRCIVSEIETYEQKIAQAEAVISTCPDRKKAVLENWLF